MPSDLVNLFYLVSAALFILGLKGLSHPRTAVRGNLLGSLAMLLAIDAGNTQTAFGLFQGEQLLADWRVATRKDATAVYRGVPAELAIREHGLVSRERVPGP